jgi:hypothetical protein
MTLQELIVRQRDILWFWLPLFASWLLMTLEGPAISAAINRLPDEVLMLAAYGIVVSLSVTIESPIINMLATATALTRDRRSYLLIRRFTIHWMILLTAITLLFGFTGMFDLVVIQLMGIESQTAEWVRTGMRIMTLWSAAIAWRRFLQGVLIRYRRTRLIAWGTLVRLIASGGSAVVLALWSAWPGIVVGTAALMIGVIAEAIYATIAVRPLLRNQLGPESPPADGDPLSYRELFWFHLPLAGTSLLTLLVQPMVAAVLARLDQPVATQAAWSLITGVLLIGRAAAFALPEAVIALTHGPHTYRPLRTFTLRLTVVTTIVSALILYTPLIQLYLFQLQDADRLVGELTRVGLFFFLPLFALTILIAWLRGLLINTRQTKVVNIGMGVNLLATGALLYVGLQMQLPGLFTSALALNVAALLELVALWWGAQRSIRAIENRPVEQLVAVRA